MLIQPLHVKQSKSREFAGPKYLETRLMVSIRRIICHIAKAEKKGYPVRLTNPGMSIIAENGKYRVYCPYDRGIHPFESMIEGLPISAFAASPKTALTSVSSAMVFVIGAPVYKPLRDGLESWHYGSQDRATSVSALANDIGYSIYLKAFGQNVDLPGITPKFKQLIETEWNKLFPRGRVTGKVFI